MTASADGVRLLDSPLPATSVSDELRAYPADLLSSALDQTSATLHVTPGSGGLLVSANLFGTSWRPIFLINIPLGIIVFFASRLVVPANRSPHPAGIDLPVLASHFCEFEDLLVNDGCTGVAVLADGRPVEVQFDEHKLFHVYAPDLRPFRRVLKRLGVRRRKALSLISEAEHLHHTTDDHAEAFRQLCVRVGVGDFDRVFSDESW